MHQRRLSLHTSNQLLPGSVLPAHDPHRRAVLGVVLDQRGARSGASVAWDPHRTDDVLAVRDDLQSTTAGHVRQGSHRVPLTVCVSACLVYVTA